MSTLPLSMVTCVLPSGRSQASCHRAPNFFELARERVRKHDAKREHFFGLVRRVAVHDALVARAAGIDALRDVGGLLGDRVRTPRGRRCSRCRCRRSARSFQNRLSRSVFTSPPIMSVPWLPKHSTPARLEGSCVSIASKIASDIWSQTLSGWPLVTLSVVYRFRIGTYK